MILMAELNVTGKSSVSEEAVRSLFRKVQWETEIIAEWKAEFEEFATGKNEFLEALQQNDVPLKDQIRIVKASRGKKSSGVGVEYTSYPKPKSNEPLREPAVQS